MTISELKKELANKQHEIIKLAHERDVLLSEYCKENAPLKIGDRVSYNGQMGYIVEVCLNDYEDAFDYVWKGILPDGSLADCRHIYCTDVHLLIKC